MSQPIHKAGAAGPFLTVNSKVHGERITANFTIEGPFAALDGMSDTTIIALLPTGYAIQEKRLDPADVGMGKMIIRATKYAGPTESNTPIRTVISIEMEEVTYDLINHDSLKGKPHDICEKWLATDESDRVTGSGQNISFRYRSGPDDLETIADPAAIKFCKAYLDGIKTFNRYYPIVTKTSTYTNPPGLTIAGGSFTGGEPTFSDNIGTFDNPPITLNGYPSGFWFKSKDSWLENAGRSWNRTEAWTYTPEGSSGPHAWIYAAPSADNGDANDGGAS